MANQPAASAEVEATITRILSHRTVKGVLILSNDNGRLIRYAGPLLEDTSTTTSSSSTTGSGALGKSQNGPDITSEGDASEGQRGGTLLASPAARKYADLVRSIVASSATAVKASDDDDRVRFLRIRTKKHEVMVTPEDKYTLAVFHDPNPV